LSASAPLHARAAHDHGSLGCGQHLDGLPNEGRLRPQSRTGHRGGTAGGIEVDRTAEDIHRDLQVRRAGIACQRIADRFFDVVADTVGGVAGLGPLGDRPHDRNVIHLLQRALAQVHERALSADDEDWRVGAPGVGDAGDTVGGAGARSQDGDADLARVQSGPGVGGMHGRLFMAHIHDLDAFVQAAVVDGHHMASRECENDLDARLFERLGCQLSSVHSRLLDLLLGVQRRRRRNRGVVRIAGERGQENGHGCTRPRSLWPLSS
jgi:hypothetical protein